MFNHQYTEQVGVLNRLLGNQETADLIISDSFIDNMIELELDENGHGKE